MDNLYARIRGICDSDAVKEDKLLQKKKGGFNLLFNSMAAKFTKTIKRGIYVAFVLYNHEKSVFLVEDTVPCVEVCDTTTSISALDFAWLMKLSRSWFNLKAFRRAENITQWEMRRKLAQSIKNVQNSLGIMELGQLHHKDLKVTDDAVVLTFVKSEESVSALGGKWSQVDKIRKQHFLAPGLIEELVKCNEASCKPLTKGLYLGFLSAKTSLNSLYLMTSQLAKAV